MGSEQRSSSAVRNLRSLFENKNSDNSPDTRGRSRSGLASGEDSSRPTSRIRASFVPVEPPAAMASEAEEGGVGSGMAELKRESSAGMRRGSFSVSKGDDEGGLLELKKTVSEEAERREKDSRVPEAIPEHAAVSAVNTPMVHAEADDKQEGVEESPLADKVGKVDLKPVNPDKPTTAAEEEPSEMKPGEPVKEAAVAGGEALPPVAEDLRRGDDTAASEEPVTGGDATKEAPATAQLASAAKEAKEPASKGTPNGKPAFVSTAAPTKPSSSSLKSPASLPKKKASRSSLTAPTAASVARAASGSDRTASSKYSPPAKPKAREGTKPVDLPSRLTAPTAASRAKHEPAPSNNSLSNGHSAALPRPKTQKAPVRTTPRTSLARPESRSSQASKKPAFSQASKKPASSQADRSFLERMTRPTAASASKTHERAEMKSPPRQKPSQAKQKVNGHTKRPAAASKPDSRPGTAKSATEKAAIPETVEAPQPAEEASQAFSDPVQSGIAKDNGAETPQTNGHDGPTDGALEATPAFAGEEIR